MSVDGYWRRSGHQESFSRCLLYLFFCTQMCGVQLSLHRPLCHEGECKAALVCVFHPRFSGMEARCFSTQLEQSQCLCLPSIHSPKTGPVKSLDLLKPHHDPHCSSGLRKSDLLTLSFLWWKFFSSSQCYEIFWFNHLRKFHKSLELLKLHTWKLSSNSSVSWDFLRRLQRLPFQTQEIHGMCLPGELF